MPPRETNDFWRGKIEARVDDLEEQVEGLKQKIWWLITAIAGALLTNFPSLLRLIEK